MQKRNEETFGDISGVHVIADDLIIAAADEQEHDRTLRKVLERARDKGVKFNSGKIQFKIDQVEYMGNLVSSTGLKPDPKKVEAIINMPQPSDVPSLQRLLGMIKYLSQYIPNESAITAPLRELLKKDAEWSWNHEHDRAMDKLRDILSSEPVLAFYDVTRPVTIQADASQSGLGAGLLQDGKPVAYASRSMTSAEENYSQIEKEMLAMCFATSKFHQYIYGKPGICVQTDHKPLESILKKPMCKAPPRLQRLMMRIQPYDLIVSYVPGKYMYLADTLSRAYVKGEPEVSLDEEMSRVVHSLVENTTVSASKMCEIRDAAQDDPALQQIKRLILDGWPKSIKGIPAEARPYWNIRDELHIAEGVIFVGERVVIPEQLRKQMLLLVHESHLGAEKCKARARTVMYWPGMAQDIENVVSKCSVCLKYSNSQAKEPMIPHEIKDGRWRKIAMDIMTYHGNDFLVIVDYYSKYPEFSQLPDKTAKTIVAHTKSVCSRHGIPEEIVSDNMPFGSREFREYAREWGIKVTTSSPGYAQSNGQAERYVQTLKNLFKKADEDGRDPYLALLEYRNTPITGLQYSPAQLLMSRTLRSKLPTSEKLLQPKVVDAHADLQRRQESQKAYYDRRTVPLKQLQPGDVVRVQRGKVWDPAIVTGVCDQQPRSYIIQNEHGSLRRNRRHLKNTAERPPLLVPPDDVRGPTQEVRPPPPTAEPRPVEPPPPEPPVAVASPRPVVVAASPKKTKCGRPVVVPRKYNDYV